jgi:hypothetical protein
MKQASCVVLILLLIFPALLYAQQSAAVRHLETRYDRIADTTTVTRDLIQSIEATGRLIVRASASFQGKEPKETARFWLDLAWCKGGATRRTQPAFMQAVSISLFVDSAQLDVPVKDYGNDFFEVNHLLAEQARAEISPEDSQKLLNTKHLTGKWGGAEFKFSDAALAALKDFISGHVFAASMR